MQPSWREAERRDYVKEFRDEGCRASARGPNLPTVQPTAPRARQIERQRKPYHEQLAVASWGRSMTAGRLLSLSLRCDTLRFAGAPCEPGLTLILSSVPIMLGFLHTELAKRFAMDIEQEIDALTKAVSTEAARTDAVAAAIAGVLLASRGNPEIAKSVSERLEYEYSVQRTKPQSDHYMRSFDVMREYFRKLVE
jgi:hypothetical protein